MHLRRWCLPELRSFGFVGIAVRKGFQVGMWQQMTWLFTMTEVTVETSKQRANTDTLKTRPHLVITMKHNNFCQQIRHKHAPLWASWTGINKSVTERTNPDATKTRIQFKEASKRQRRWWITRRDRNSRKQTNLSGAAARLLVLLTAWKLRTNSEKVEWNSYALNTACLRCWTQIRLWCPRRSWSSCAAPWAACSKSDTRSWPEWPLPPAVESHSSRNLQKFRFCHIWNLSLIWLDQIFTEAFAEVCVFVNEHFCTD